MLKKKNIHLVTVSTVCWCLLSIWCNCFNELKQSSIWSDKLKVNSYRLCLIITFHDNFSGKVFTISRLTPSLPRFNPGSFLLWITICTLPQMAFWKVVYWKSLLSLECTFFKSWPIFRRDANQYDRVRASLRRLLIPFNPLKLHVSVLTESAYHTKNIWISLPRKYHNKETFSSRGIERRRDEEQIITKQTNKQKHNAMTWSDIQAKKNNLELSAEKLQVKWCGGA